MKLALYTCNVLSCNTHSFKHAELKFRFTDYFCCDVHLSSPVSTLDSRTP
jgi:hypothetical protein